MDSISAFPSITTIFHIIIKFFFIIKENKLIQKNL